MSSAQPPVPDHALSDPHRQLHLPIELLREPTLTEYLPGPNAEALAAVRTMAEGAGEPFVFLFGQSGTGKTHLLQAACLAATERDRKASFVPLGISGIEPSLLESLELRDLVAVDDIQAIAGHAGWERALFDLFNRIREQRRQLLVAAVMPPESLPFELADLGSRLQWGPRYQLHPLTEADSQRLLVEAARHRGMRLSLDQARYILNNHPRDPASLVALVTRIDSLSLREQRQPTIPLIKRAMLE